MTKIDYMKIAIDEARQGIHNKHGGPFGSVVVKDGKIVGRGHNQVLKNNDPTAHGEIMAIRDACNNLETIDLSGCELYTSAEPCPMCYGAIQWAKIDKVYYGCNVDDTENLGFKDRTFQTQEVPSECILSENCKQLFKEYESLEHKLY